MLFICNLPKIHFQSLNSSAEVFTLHFLHRIVVDLLTVLISCQMNPSVVSAAVGAKNAFSNSYLCVIFQLQSVRE